MLEYFKQMAYEHNLSLENVLSIALNRYGVLMNNVDDNRLRFNLKMLNAKNSTYFAVCLNTFKDSPFTLENNTLYLEDTPIGTVSEIVFDTCVSAYFRNDKKSLTFNSNSRSKCVGCKFCGTYSLANEDELDFSNEKNIIDYFSSLLKSNDISSMKNLENVTIVTGCFDSEAKLIEHLLTVNDAFKKMGFNGNLNYIGSQLRDYEEIRKLSKVIDKFGLYLTIEKFLDREKFMRPDKANLTLEKARDLMNYSKSLEIPTTFLYILGLEDLKIIKEYFNYFKESINKFPIVQVFQDYTERQELYRCEEAKDIEYYIKAREFIEDIFKDSNFNQKLWECRRSLYFDEEEETKGLVKCKKKN